ncbi:MAG: phosphatidylinositol transfer protein [Proteobacteria bacterium]|nr:MAG: phosphatidylinositol transfer protein [Pseudomonadota bacterium]
MNLKSWAMVSLCLLAFACKKESGKKSSPAPAPAVSENETGKVDPVIDPAKTGQGEDSVGNLPQSCRAAIDCSQALPDPGPAVGFKGQFTEAFVKLGAVHRGRDSVINQGQDANLIAKFAYGVGLDKDAKDEQVDIYMQMGCTDGWKKLGTTRTSKEPTTDQTLKVDGVEDTGGFVMVTLSSLGVKDLAVGRYRFILFLRANNEHTELFVEVLPKKNAIVLTDIDGTLTAFEEAAATEILFKSHPEAHAGAADMMRSFYHRGYNIFYLTARPAFLMERTRMWLNVRGFPPGIIHTTNLVQGAIGEAAAQFKVDELALLKKNTGIIPTYAFGNKPSDVKAFGGGGVAKDHSWFYKITGDTTMAQAHDDYRTLIPMAQAAPSFCP